MYGDLGRTYLFDLDFTAVGMIKERLAKEAKEAEERALGIGVAGSSKSKKKPAFRSPSPTPPQEGSDSEAGSGMRVNSEYTVDAFYIGNVSNIKILCYKFFF